MGYLNSPWGIEQTNSMLWVGPMRPDGEKVDEVVAGLSYGADLTHSSRITQLRRAALLSAAPELLDALENLVIGIGMGWDLDGLIGVSNRAIAKALGKEEV